MNATAYMAIGLPVPREQSWKTDFDDRLRSGIAVIYFCLAALGCAGCSTQDAVNTLMVVVSDIGPQEYTFQGASIRGRVLEYRTEVPIPGVSVTVRWSVGTTYGAVEGREGTFAVVYIAEAITDAEGRFEFPAWEGVRYRISDDTYKRYFLGDYVGGGISGPSRKLKFMSDACLFAYLPGRYFGEYCNPRTDLQIAPGIQKSVWNNRDIYLRTTLGNPSDRRDSMSVAVGKAMGSLGTSESTIEGKRLCGWNRTPVLIRYALKEEHEIHASKPKVPVVKRLAKSIMASSEKPGPCGPVEPFLKELLGEYSK